ncbi:hypothetical protein ACJX0J_027143 [Zea mays]
MTGVSVIRDGQDNTYDLEVLQHLECFYRVPEVTTLGQIQLACRSPDILRFGDKSILTCTDSTVWMIGGFAFIDVDVDAFDFVLDVRDTTNFRNNFLFARELLNLCIVYFYNCFETLVFEYKSVTRM